MKIRKHMFVSGMVQGVGFRYRAYRIAVSLGLTGWVENLLDRRVELEVQGEEYKIEQFVERLKEERFILIAEIEQERIPIKEEEADFQIHGW